MNKYVGLILYKIRAIFSRKLAFSSVAVNSKISKKSAIKQRTRFYGSSLNNYSYIGRNCLIQNTSIGKFCSVPDNCNIGMPSHPLDYISTSPVFLEGKNVVKFNFSKHRYCNIKNTIIGNDVWIGYGASIKSGVTIGDGAVIGAGSVVTHDIPPYEVWAGVPAKLIKKRFDDETILRLLKVKWWDWDYKTIKEKADYFNDINRFLENN